MAALCWRSALAQAFSEAAHHARASLFDGFDLRLAELSCGLACMAGNALVAGRRRTPATTNLYRISAAVLRTHESKAFPGGLIASLSIPWGFTKGDDDLGGYHLVWPAIWSRRSAA